VKPPSRLVLLALPLAGVGLAPIAVRAAEPPAHAAKTTIAVTATEFKFKLSPSSASPGAVTFNIKNAGKVKHDLKIAGKKSSLIKPGKTGTLSVTLKRGSYPYLCTVKGHAKAGMKGTLQVR
jgi:uncharacterized cupredoxin-like copper-binding protein